MQTGGWFRRGKYGLLEINYNAIHATNSEKVLCARCWRYIGEQDFYGTESILMLSKVKNVNIMNKDISIFVSVI